MKSEVYKREVKKQDELLTHDLDPAACIKKREDQFERTTHNFRTRVAKCIEVNGVIFRTFVVNCNNSVIPV